MSIKAPARQAIYAKFSLSSLSPLFLVQAFAAFNDNILRSAVLVLVTFAVGDFTHISRGVVVNVAVFLYIIPFLLFSSYAGKLADIYDKIYIIRWIKIFELVIVSGAACALYFNHYGWLLVSLFAFGLHSTFFGPIKYAILAQYYPSNEIGLATGYVELGTFMAILLGQTFGSCAMATRFTPEAINNTPHEEIIICSSEQIAAVTTMYKAFKILLAAITCERQCSVAIS